MGYIIVNLCLLFIFICVGKSVDDVVLTFCVYLFVMGISNIIIAQTNYSVSTERGRLDMLRMDHAQREYDSKYRNYVKEAEDKKGMIEYKEKKR